MWTLRLPLYADMTVVQERQVVKIIEEIQWAEMSIKEG